jgi:hypothetical protein
MTVLTAVHHRLPSLTRWIQSTSPHSCAVFFSSYARWIQSTSPHSCVVFFSSYVRWIKSTSLHSCAVFFSSYSRWIQSTSPHSCAVSFSSYARWIQYKFPYSCAVSFSSYAPIRISAEISCAAELYFHRIQRFHGMVFSYLVQGQLYLYLTGRPTWQLTCTGKFHKRK